MNDFVEWNAHNQNLNLNMKFKPFLIQFIILNSGTIIVLRCLARVLKTVWIFRFVSNVIMSWNLWFDYNLESNDSKNLWKSTQDAKPTSFEFAVKKTCMWSRFIIFCSVIFQWSFIPSFGIWTALFVRILQPHLLLAAPNASKKKRGKINKNFLIVWTCVYIKFYGTSAILCNKDW